MGKKLKEIERHRAGTPEHKSERVEIRCSAAVKRHAEGMAKKAKCTVSEWIVRLIDGAR